MKKEKQKNPYLHFEFANSEQDITPVTFANPKEVIIAKKAEEVHHVLEQVQAFVNAGYYAAGYITYEAGAAFTSSIKRCQSDQPLVWFGIFDCIMEPEAPMKGAYHLSDWELNIDRQTYQEKFSIVQNYLKQQVTNQVNYTVRMHARFSGDAFTYYEQLKRAQAAKYTCYIQTDEQSIVSASPELFFRVKDGQIITRPMAGTAPRGKTYEEDRTNREQLGLSEKNKRENKLIVDLLCKDLAPIAEEGKVSIPHLYEIEQYPTVFQMTSTVTAPLKNGFHLSTIFEALFPTASMTGDPKTATMDIIEEVETSPRGVYSGAIGYLTPEKEAVFNVPIRTVVIDRQTEIAEYGVGGGITIHSTAEDEYKEILTKTAVLKDNRSTFQLLESLRLENGIYFLLEEHMHRLLNSAMYFSMTVDSHHVRKVLHQFAMEHKYGTYKVRLRISDAGSPQIEGQQIKQDLTVPQLVTLAKIPIQKEGIFLYHKTTNRYMYERRKIVGEDAFDTLLWNEEDELTEFTNGNLVVEWDGKYYTPPISSGLLPGTFRSSLLKRGIIHEKILKKAELPFFTRIWFINSVRKWVPVYVD